MKRPILLFSALFAFSAFLPAQHEIRTFTNAQGKAVQARLVAVEGTMVKIALANGTPYTLPIASLSAADQEYLKTAATSAPTAVPSATATFKASPNDKLAPVDVNEAVGHPLFGDAPLWDSSAEELAQKLSIPPESKTKESSSFRSYTQEDFQMFGAHPFSVAMYAQNDKVTGFSLVFANKGDLFSAKGGGEMHFDKDTPPAQAASIVRKAMDKDVQAITAVLTKKLGTPLKQRIGDSASVRENMLRWDWRGHSILLADVEGEYVGVQIVTSRFADAGGKVEDTLDDIIRNQVLAKLEKRENGDVVISDIPMVDQGPKGYCAPATAERAMRFLGIPADMYILANKGNSGFGGGTNMETMLEGMKSQILSKRRSFDAWSGEMKLKELAKNIDKGLPVMWLLCSTEDFNETANRRTKERKNVTNWADWKTKVTTEASANSLPKDKETRHVVLIIGYNKDTNEIAFSDSWGEDFKERWITLQEAQQVSDDRYYVIGF